MDIFTLYVGQGDLTAVRAGGEALVIDAHMPDGDDLAQKQIEKSLDGYLAKSRVRGLILTGFDRDHACPAGVEYVLLRYEPDWVMYPKYFKDSDSAADCFKIIEAHEKIRRNSLRPLVRYSVRVDHVESRFFTDLAIYFNLELFSPHMADMDSSNNSSLVLKVQGLDPTSFSYLVTGDTEIGRWDTINTIFGPRLKCDVLSAAHHGSHNGVHPGALLQMSPNTVLISAGGDNMYGHPDPAAVKAYSMVAKHVFATNSSNDGHCLFTRRQGDDFVTIPVRHPAVRELAAAR
jgi:beta-lactamase superfamily II metal-dependent hydrolase